MVCPDLSPVWAFTNWAAGVSITGLVELSDVARAIDTKKWAGRFGLVGLQDLAAEYTDRYLSKEADVRCGKWDAAKLSEEQKLCSSSLPSCCDMLT